MTLVLCGLIALIAGGCSSKEEEKKPQTEKLEEPSKQEETKSEIEIDPELTREYVETTTTKYMLNVPASGLRGRSFADILHISEDNYILFDQYLELGHEDFHYSIEDIKTLDDVIPAMKEQILALVCGNSVIGYYKDIVVDSSEYMTINGFDFLKARAHVEVTEDKKISDNQIPMVIYATIKNGFTMYMAAVDESANHSNINETEKLLDKIAKTFRDID